MRTPPPKTRKTPAMVDKTETDAVADLARQAHHIPDVVRHDNGRAFLMIPDGADTFREVDITDPHALATEPLAFVRQGVTLQTVDSLVDYVNRFKSPDTVLLADIANSRIAALIDYHTPPTTAIAEGDAAPTEVAPAQAQPVTHRAAMALPFSEEWKTWRDVSGKMMPQKEFAQFLEENLGDISRPSGADLLDVARDLQAVRKADFKRVVRTNGDDESFEYSEETTAGARNGTVEVPTHFALQIPVYFGSRTVELQAFLRWKLEEGALLLGIKLHRPEHVRQAMFHEIVGDAGDRTGQPVLYGALDTDRPKPPGA